MINSKEKVKDHINVTKSEDLYKWSIYFFGSIAFMFSFFHRTNTAVLVPHLIETFKTSGTMLGLLSGIYFYSYGPLQPVIGVLTDRWKPRKMLTLFISIMSLGTLIYAYSPTFAITCIGRFLIGVGSAGIYIPIFWTITKYFAYNKRGFIFSILVFSGNIGFILATSPFAKLISLFGWRLALANVAFVSFTVALLVWLIVKENNSNKIGEACLDNESVENVTKVSEKVSWIIVCREVFNIPIIKYCLISIAFSFGAKMSFQGLWAIPFLMDIYKLERFTASNLIIMIPVGFMAGILLFSRFNDTKYGKYIYFTVNAGSAIIYLIFTILIPKIPYHFLPISLFLMGLSHGAIPYIFKVFSLVLPKQHYGTALGIINLFPFIGCALYQSFTGLLFDLFGGSTNVLYRTIGSYKLYFLCLTLSLVISTLANFVMIKILNKSYKGG